MYHSIALVICSLCLQLDLAVDCLESHNVISLFIKEKSKSRVFVQQSDHSRHSHELGSFLLAISLPSLLLIAMYYFLTSLLQLARTQVKV